MESSLANPTLPARCFREVNTPKHLSLLGFIRVHSWFNGFFQGNMRSVSWFGLVLWSRDSYILKGLHPFSGVISGGVVAAPQPPANGCQAFGLDGGAPAY